MTSEIRLQESSLEHMLKQPSGLRYALFCDSVFKGVLEGDCDSKTRGGHIGDYEDYTSARDTALTHPHAALIRFYPDYETRQPTQDFLVDFRKQSDHIDR